jgi:hypothetical protein
LVLKRASLLGLALGWESVLVLGLGWESVLVWEQELVTA